MKTNPLRALPLALLLWVPACTGDSGPPGVAPPVDIPAPGVDDDLPGVVVEVVQVHGQSGADGSFRVGDRVSVDFTLTTTDGRPIHPSFMTRGAIMLSGPTFNYQRVLASQADLFANVVEVRAGVWRYTFADPIPATYLEPLNYTGRFTAGVLAGQPLLTGTYTVGIEARKDYVIGLETVRDVGNAHADVRFGGAERIDPRAVVDNANCNVCHDAIQAHGGNRTDVVNCLLCHTAGAEDRNTPSVLGGTPDITIEFKVMIHKIHAGRSLPSVKGVTTDAAGARDYAAAPRPYRVVGFGNRVHDYSGVGFPVWPSLFAGMPRDAGYGGLSPAQQAQEDAMLAGPVACNKCHGDPDGAGPATAPAQGALAFAQPSRRACGSCHDDWVFDRPYVANGERMDPQLDDSQCIKCHAAGGAPLAVRDAHLHPLVDPALAKGLHIEVSAVQEAGAHNGDGTLDPGEKAQITFTIRDDAGADLAPSAVSRVQAVIHGPAANPNLLYNQSFPTAALGAGPVHVSTLPERILLEFAGTSTAGNGDTFDTARAPHWNVSGATTAVWTRGTPAAGSTLAAQALAGQNFVDLAVNGGTSFSRDDIVVLDAGVGGKEEYMKVQLVDGDRLWFSSPHTGTYKAALTVTHDATATVAPVTLVAKVKDTDYALDAATGRITELIEFGTGAAVIVEYTTDFVVPPVYPGSPNDSPDLDSAHDKWRGLPLVDGTYRLTFSGRIQHTVTRAGQATTYSEGNRSAARTFVVGAPVPSPGPRIETANACARCHEDLQFHGGNHRGYDTCLGCHGASGAEDRPRYVARDAPATTGRRVEFRAMIHALHHGKELTDGAGYQVVGFGGDPWPDNFSVHTYDKVGFPDLPGGTKRCASCHGAGNAASRLPAARTHPLGQPKPSRAWRNACLTCHDDGPAAAHVDANTTASGVESCVICHGANQEWNVGRMHRVR